MAGSEKRGRQGERKEGRTQNSRRETEFKGTAGGGISCLPVCVHVLVFQDEVLLENPDWS